MPRISVILPVYNCEIFLQDALQSLQAQTYRDFEIIAINDGSTDQSGAILDSCKDPRLKVIHQENLGLALTLNVGLKHASGEFIARQDQDDISMPTRFSQQLAYLEQNLRCGLLGTHAVIWKNNSTTHRAINYPSGNILLQLFGLFQCLFVHSSVMARTQCMIDAGLYPTSPERNPPEDFDLWLRMMQICDVANIAKPLLIYREVASGITKKNNMLIQQRTHDIATENIANILGNNKKTSSCSDLVATLRFDATRLSAKPDWQLCEELLADLAGSLLERYPNDLFFIQGSVKKLKNRMRFMQSGRFLLGNKALPHGLKAARFLKKHLVSRIK